MSTTGPTPEAVPHGTIAQRIEGSPRSFVLSDRRTLADLLAASLQVVGSAAVPGPDVLEAARSGAVLIVDGDLDPDDRLLGACIARSRALGAAVAVLFCSTEPIAAARWIEIGASAVLTHAAPLREIEDTLARLARSETVLGVSVREGLLSRLRSQRQIDAERNALFLGLTRREAQVLRALALGASPEEVARTSFVSLNTVRTQIRGVLAKLGVTSVVAAVALAYRTGWMAPDLI